MPRIANRDDVLVGEYMKIPNESSESVIRNDELSAKLLRGVNRRLPKEAQFSVDEMKKRLENLRKSSKLPRKFRAFNGRNGKPKPR